MEKEMKLSIIVPVYNMASDHKLEYCLDSLVNQTVEDYEIIAVDDCSTDNSMEILKEYERRFPEKFPDSPFGSEQASGGREKHRTEDGQGGMDWLY